MTTEAILETNQNFKLLDFDATKQLPDENLGIGDNTWVSLSVVEQEHALLKLEGFISLQLKKMLKKCPFGDSINDLGILLQPVKSCTYDVSTILRLAKKFPQLKLDTSECLKHLKEEFSDLLSQSEIQHLITTCSAWDPSFNPLELQGK